MIIIVILNFVVVGGNNLRHGTLVVELARAATSL